MVAAAVDGAEQRCPKCRRPRRADEAACARCGLLVVRFAAFTGDGEEPAELEDRWRACRAGWDDPAAHDRALDAASRLQRLPALARRYREVLDGASDDLVAVKRLAQIALLIETAARAQARTETSPRASRALWMLCYLVAAAMLLASLWAAFLAGGRH